jgi:hypothetical protein
MRRAFTALLIAAASTSLAAQTSNAARPTSQAPADGSTVTVTGCLAKGDSANTFVLTNVRWDSTGAATRGQAGHHQQQPPAPSTPPMTTPTTPSTAPADSAAKKTADEALQRAATDKAANTESLRIAGNTAQLKLADHVGHTITATGMIAKADPVVTPGVVLPDPPADKKPAPKPSSASPMRVLNVRSFNHVAPACD